MDHERIAADGTVGRYLRDELSADDAEAFEQHYLTCQQCLDELAETQALRQGLTDLVESGKLPQAGAGPARPWFATPVWAAAATVLLAVSLVTNGVLLGTRSPAVAPGSAEVFGLVTVRNVASGEPVNEVVAAPATQTVVLLVDSGRLDDAGPFAATIVPEASPEKSVRLAPLTADAKGNIAVSVPVAMLSAGIYRIDVSEHGAASVLNSARFVWRNP